MSSKNIKRVSLYLPVEDYKLLKRVAYESDCKLNDVARQAIENISGQAVVIQKAT